ncbi:hypothetical protein L596_022139 [Steinernema carpocapsae]|uniref:Uncharacterized protein n=1 Tax=Steinernema carpocapsae TaxID=34508 RepID=A0A4U5MKY2_STECR|nr:hypothetical protein L596_022139 [Steinernema carpocapsae]
MRFFVVFLLALLAPFAVSKEVSRLKPKPPVDVSEDPKGSGVRKICNAYHNYMDNFSDAAKCADIKRECPCKPHLF